VYELYYQPEGVWFGDCMPFFHEGVYYLFHQRDTRRPGPFGEPFGWALATTTDFVIYTDHGEIVLRGADDEQDQFNFAGSVFAANGRFVAAYTGFNRDFPQLGKPSQVLMAAVSDDLLHWEKTADGLVSPQEGYEPDDWRDPFVLWDDEHQRYLMILGARAAGERILTGRTVAFTSTDATSWEFAGDFWAPGLFSMHEMPDLFRIGDWWYLLTTEYSDSSKTVYRRSRSLDGRGPRRATTRSTGGRTTRPARPPALRQTMSTGTCSAGCRPRRTTTSSAGGSGAARSSYTRSISALTDRSGSGRQPACGQPSAPCRS